MDRSASAVVVTYLDENAVVNLSNTVSATTTPGTQGWYANWISGSSPLLDPDERVEFYVNIESLSTLLSTSTQFRIEVKPQVGATLVVERTTPAEIKTVNNLQ